MTDSTVLAVSLLAAALSVFGLAMNVYSLQCFRESVTKAAVFFGMAAGLILVAASAYVGLSS